MTSSIKDNSTQWLNVYKHELSDGQLKPETKQFLDQVAPDWDADVEPREVENARLEAIVAELLPDSIEAEFLGDGQVTFRSRELAWAKARSWADGPEKRQRRLVSAALARLEAKLSE